MAEQTNLDTIGIPCFAAIRPNSRTLAVHQGKGRDAASARISATMEAIEFAVAEAPGVRRATATIQELRSSGRDHYLPVRSLPRDCRPSPHVSITWVKGIDMGTGRPVLVPLDAVALTPNAPERLPFSQSSTGLGAGITPSEAAAHAFRELLERDASTLWSLGSPARTVTTGVDLNGIDDDDVADGLAKVAVAGFELRLFDLTTDLQLPVVMALIWSGRPRMYFDVASGVCAHPSAPEATLGAIFEAAQTRISNIAGSRDDIEPDEYGRPLPDWLAGLLRSSGDATRALPRSLTPQEFDALPGRMEGRTIAVPLVFGDISVVKLLSETMEDRSTNVHWRPGARAIRAITRL